jgi:hypothetical protein
MSKSVEPKVAGLSGAGRCHANDMTNRTGLRLTATAESAPSVQKGDVPHGPGAPLRVRVDPMPAAQVHQPVVGVLDPTPEIDLGLSLHVSQ